MSDLQQIDYLRGRVHQLEEQIILERSSYQVELSRIASSLSNQNKLAQISITSLQKKIASNRRESEILFSSVWQNRD
jgi:hypothetical protein